VDSSVQVALIGIFVAIVTTTGLVIVAIINNRRERGDSAQKAMERVHKERLELKDEIIKELRMDVSELTAKIERLQRELTTK
jgi:5-bromo-4-chloroindolyl phosphate hydrolysis protein